MVCSLRVVALALVLGVPLRAAQGQGWIEPVRVLPLGPRGAIEKVRSAVQVTLDGRAARVTVEEWFRNAGPALDEASYLYPLPGEAAFSDFSLWQGDRELKGEPMDAVQARTIYEEIVRRKRDPALIELAGHGLLRARVFPLASGETRRIALRYSELLERVGDALRFRYATGPHAGAAPSRSLRIEVDSAGRFGEPYSPTHRVRVTRDGGRMEITLADTSARGDLELFLPIAKGLVGLSFVGRQGVSEDGYFMLLLAPGRPAEAQAVRRDLVAVLDVSGSMSGEKLDQAQAALTQLLGTLRAGDRFRVIAFSGGVQRFAAGWTAATSDAVGAAQAWVRRLVAGGGTNIAGALTEALAAPADSGALGVVVLLTDGMPTVGETDPERIADQAERGRGAFRVFAFGIGYDVNTYLLDRLTERARGVTAYIQPGGDIEQTVGALAAKVSSPVLTDLALAADGVELYDVQPERLPDLFAGDELVVFGRYRASGGTGAPGSGDRMVTVTGRRGGRAERFSTSARLGDDAPGAGYVEQLWAARKAGALSRQLRLHGANPEIVDELKRLALRYGILTEYTSYLVQEPGAIVERQQWMRRPAPQDQVGARAVQGAVAAERLAQTAQLDAVTVTGMAARPDSVAAPFGTGDGRGLGTRTERAGGRVFVLRAHVWTDIGQRDSLRVVHVAAFSDAYFALLRALPELVGPAALAPAVLVAGHRVSVEIAERGQTAWGEGELEQLVRDFRG